VKYCRRPSPLPLLGSVLLLSLAVPGGCAADAPDRFGIYTADLSGDNVQTVVADAERELTHPRVSHNGQWITFTRYNDKGPDGCAREAGGYADTEIMIVRVDGTGLQSVVAPKPGVLAANSSWLPDDSGLVFLSTDNPQRLPQIMTVDLASRTLARLPAPAGAVVSDPHVVGNLVVFPAFLPGRPGPLWIMTRDGSAARQLTYPPLSGWDDSGNCPPGDYDPRIAPDGTRVAFMRPYQQGWHSLVVDVATGQEHDLSGPGDIDGTPDWSGDGTKLILWHVNLANLAETGVYTMNPDGTGREMVPLPRGYQHGHPGFFPGDALSPAARIVYDAELYPGLP